MKKLVVLTGAGISAESGLKTFRDMGGLWENYNVMEVASPQAWNNDPELVLRFYNDRRKQLLQAEPNEAHQCLAKLEDHFDVHIITQNVDDLHERAGSTKVLHLHGELRKARSTVDPSMIYPLQGWELKTGDLCDQGSQLRPHVVWFGEAVEAIPEAIETARQAEVYMIIGTSLNVYPAAGLVDFFPEESTGYLIDPNTITHSSRKNLTIIRKNATAGMREIYHRLT